MSHLNRDTYTPKRWTKVWAGAVGANTPTLDTYTQKCARVIVVGTVPVGGVLNLIQAGNNAVSFTDVDIIAQNYCLRGQWESIVAAGSTCYDLMVGI